MTAQTEDVSPKTFDLAAALAGRTYPEIKVPIFLDEELQFKLSELDKKISTATNEEVEELEGDRQELLGLFHTSVIWVTVKGAPRHVRKATAEKVMADHPVEYTPLGQVKPNPAGDEAIANATWAIHVVEFSTAKGETLVPSEADIIAFRGQAPDSAVVAVESAIHELTSGSKAGYETAVQDLDFLSRP